MTTNAIVDVNKTMLGMYGYSNKEEVLKCTLEDLSAVEEGYNKERIIKMNHDVIHSNLKTFEWRAKKKNGQLFWSQVSLRKVVIGGKERIMASVRDINECKYAEHLSNERMKELQAFYNLAEISEREGITLDELYQEFINILPKSFQYTEIACARIVVNDKQFSSNNFKETIWKLSSPFHVNGDVTGRIDLYYLEERAEIDEGPFMMEERLLIDAIAKRIGQITSRKRTEDALRFKNLVFDVSIVANCIADLEGNITEANNMFIRIWGYSSKDEVIGKSIQDFVEDLNVADAIAISMEMAGQWEGEFIAKKKDKSTFVAYGLGTFVCDENNNIIGYQAAIMDITDRKQAEELLKNYNFELEQRVSERTAVAENRAQKLHDLSKQLISAEEKERKRIAYILHTEVQQILVGARIALQTGIKIVSEPAPLSSLMAAERMLEEALKETTELVYEIVPPVLRECGLQEAIIWLSHQMRDRHNFSVDVKSDDQMLYLDDDVSVCAYQAIREMLLNIYKHANVGHAEIFFQKLNDKRLKLTVIDKGSGFITKDFSNSKDLKIGFGLRDIRHRVEGLGGGIEIDSTLGQGTSISLYLPMKSRIYDEELQ
jgi:PAS domain S-box-containing protein